MVPLLILSEDGRVVDAGFSSEKAYTKSLEQGTLWVVHGETGRVLPYSGSHTLHHLNKHGHYVVAVVEAGEVGEVGEGSSTGAPSPSAPEAADTRESDSGDAAGREPGHRVLEALEAMIHARKRELPEGSYTTHLFSEGGEKIRKKLGEEAVELLLASSRDRIVSESADLIYHLLVLLVQEDIPVSEIAEELGRRHAGG